MPKKIEKRGKKKGDGIIEGMSPEILNRLYHEEFLTLEQIGNEFNCSRETVRSRMKLYGIPTRKSGYSPEDHRRINKIEKDLLYTLHIKQKWSLSKIARQEGTGIHTIKKLMERYGIPITNNLIIPRELSEEYAEELRYLYEEKEYSMHKLAIHFGFHDNTILRHMKELNIPRRNSGWTRRKADIDIEKLKILHIEKKWKIQRCADYFVYSYGTIYRKLVENKIKPVVRKTTIGGNIDIVIEPEALEFLYYEKEWSMEQISNYFKCSSTVIYNLMKLHNIERRTNSKAQLARNKYNKEVNNE